MRFSLSPHKNRLAAATLLGASILTSAGVVSALPASAHCADAIPTSVSSAVAGFAPVSLDAPAGLDPKLGSGAPLLKGSTKASYFWDDASGRAGDTGLPASGKPMQKGMIASPSWPLFTEGYVIYKGKKAPFFVGDRGPGTPSSSGIMIDIDAKTFADLTGGTFNSDTLAVEGNGGLGHIDVQYVVTKWGDGAGKKNYPMAFSTGAWSRKDNNPATPPKIDVVKD